MIVKVDENDPFRAVLDDRVTREPIYFDTNDTTKQIFLTVVVLELRSSELPVVSYQVSQDSFGHL